MKIAFHKILNSVSAHTHSTDTELTDLRQVTGDSLQLVSGKLAGDMRVARRPVVFTVDRERFTVIDGFSNRKDIM